MSKVKLCGYVLLVLGVLSILPLRFISPELTAVQSLYEYSGKYICGFIIVICGVLLVSAFDVKVMK